MPAKAKGKALTKAQMTAELAAATGQTKAQINGMFDAMNDLIEKQLKAGNQVTLNGLVKITLQHKPATPARPGRNPFTGEDIMIKAKPARQVVKVRALKGLKDMA